MSKLIHLSLEQVHRLALENLQRAGASDEQARAVADIVTAAERDECKSHGLFRIPGFCASLVSGKVSGDATPVVHDLAPAVVHVDAANGFAPLALEAGSVPLAAKARSQGIAALAVTNSYHFSALWPEIELMTSQGLIAFAFVSAKKFVAPAGGIEPLYGTNPMAFGWPRENQPAVIFDQASSASARGEIQLHQRDGKQIPHGWAIDKTGNPTTDPAEALDGAQLAFGGYKGAAIAMMVELLAGSLVGDVLSFEASQIDVPDGGPSSGGEFMIAIDPGRCGNRGALVHAERLFAEILQQEGTRLPSQRRYESREKTRIDGITIVESLYESLQLA
ncbi:oxidoreductase [Chromatiales bacterium (ex Bugula neritina AB1)]|nr:oxidoreductase [Chromatiales bacterium (ex Bugula neritina AB1)]